MEVEEERRHHAKPLCVSPKGTGPELARIRIDTITGMAFSSLVSLAIVFATAATLHAHGITDIATSAQAAEALRPIACDLAFALFAVGDHRHRTPGSTGASRIGGLCRARRSAELVALTPNQTTHGPSMLLGAAVSLIGFDPPTRRKPN